MQSLIDHLIAIMVSGVVITALMSNQFRSQHSMIEQTASHSVKAKTLVFGKWVEHDILNLGANFGRNYYRFTEPTVDADGNTVAWQFYSDSVRTNGTKLRLYTRYRLVPTEVVAFQDTTMQMYIVNRDTTAVDHVGALPGPAPPESAWVQGLWSIGTLSFFRIELLDRWGETPLLTSGATNLEDVDYIRVRFGVVPEYVLKPDNYIRELYWSRTLKVRPYWQPPPA